MNLLISSIEQEDERNHAMGSSGRLVMLVLLDANGLGEEEQEHANARCEEEEATTKLIDQGGREESPEQVPDSKDTMCNMSITILHDRKNILTQ